MITSAVISQGGQGERTFADEISDLVQGKNFDRLDVAVAYATQSGLDALKDAIGGWPEKSRWVVGLDDAITQPSAIDELKGLESAEVSFARLDSEGRRFHPKLYCFWSSTNTSLCGLVFGSANMTLHGLRRNGEVGAILVAENEGEANKLKGSWSTMHALRLADAEVDLEAYRRRYKAMQEARRKARREAKQSAAAEEQEVELVGSEEFDGNPAQASIAWTEGASPSAGGRDLEFPKAMMPVFKLGQSPITKRFRTRDGSIFPMTFTERMDNQMWRLLFRADAIESAIGRPTLRPATGENRSDLAIIFQRSHGEADFDLSIVVIGSEEHQYLMQRSQEAGGLYRTRNPGGRNFGFF